MQYIFTQYSIAMLLHFLLMHRIIYNTKILFAKISIGIFEFFGILILLGFDYLDNRYKTMLYFISYNSCLNSLTIKNVNRKH